MKRPARQRNTPHIGLDDTDARLGGEPSSESAGQPGIQFDGDDAGSGIGKRRGERAVPRAEIEDEVTIADAAGTDEPPDQSTVSEEMCAGRVRPRRARTA